jgi:hypothetical protein
MLVASVDALTAAPGVVAGLAVGHPVQAVENEVEAEFVLVLP